VATGSPSFPAVARAASTHQDRREIDISEDHSQAEAIAIAPKTKRRGEQRPYHRAANAKFGKIMATAQVCLSRPRLRRFGEHRGLAWLGFRTAPAALIHRDDDFTGFHPWRATLITRVRATSLF